MRIRQVFLLSIALGSTVGAVAALLFALQQWSALQSAWRVKHDTRLLASALRVPEMMNMERAFITARMVAPASATTRQQLAPVLRQAGLVDASIAQARSLAVKLSDAAELDGMTRRLLEIRRSALDVVARPRTERPASAVTDFLNGMFKVQETAYALASAIQQRVNVINPSVGLAARLALLAWDVRDWSGRQTTVLTSYIGLGLPMEGVQAETLAEFKGRIDQKWTAAIAAVAVLDSPEVTAAEAGVMRNFWARGGEAYTTRVLPNRGRPLLLNTDSFVEAIRPVLDSVLPLRDSAMLEALRRADASIALLRLRFLLALGLMLLTASTAIAATAWFDRRVVRPARQITTTILALASGDKGVEVPLQDRADELGQMARAIETLRGNALQAEAVGREILALQQARAEEKARLLAELTQSHTELTALNAELESLAATDALTGVANRRTFNLGVLREWRRAQREDQPIGLVLLDIDHFKSFNDRYGHPAGDACLMQVAAAIVSEVRRPGDVAARYGGEEFAVVLPATELEGAANIAEAIRRAVADLEIRHADSPFGVVTVSVGAAAVFPRATGSSESLVCAADTALYAAKRAGRNRIATPAGASEVIFLSPPGGIFAATSARS